jgi:3-dehydroquinate dehydratase type I
MKICACITGKTADECISLASSLDSDLIEHRIDFMENPSDFKKIYSSTKIPVLATNRPLRSGGNFSKSEKERIALLLKSIDAGCAMVDIEIETEDSLKKEVIKKAKEKNCKVIISMHDFNKTPELKDLLEIMHNEKEQGADIGKIVTTANSMADCNIIMNLISCAEEENFPLIAFAMGEMGKFTRMVSLLESPFTFASIGEKTANGQLDLEAMKKVKEVLK